LRATLTSRPTAVAAVCAVGVAIAGGVMTDAGAWYRALDKSPLTPPDWVFGPAWTLIYALAVLAATFGWQAARSRSEKSWLIALYFVNGVLNVAWTGAFFTLRRPDWALAEVIALWLSVASLVVWSWSRSRAASGLLLPYLLWVSFAAYLNSEIVHRNGPFA
jgi:tryptophan-rich sensory protein